MLVEIGAMVDRERAVVHRRAVADHHEDSAFLGAIHDPAMGPNQRLAVNIFLEQSLAHHQPERFARTAIGFVSRLVDDMPEVVEAARMRRTPGGEPVLAALSAL